MQLSKTFIQKTFAMLGAAVAALTLAGTASAATVTTFDLSNVALSDGSSMTGTILIDSTGAFVSGDVFAEGSEFNTITSSGYAPFQGTNQFWIDLASATDSDALFLVIPGDSLSGYTGGDLCSQQSSSCFFYSGVGSVLVTSGGLTPAPETAASTDAPEPGTNALLGGGLMAAGLAVRKRLAK